MEICLVFVVVTGFKESLSKIHLLCRQSAMGGSRTHDPVSTSVGYSSHQTGGVLE